MKIAVSAILGLHMLLSNLCVMPMAFAQDSSMPSEAYEESMEMTMTPAIPMSPANCESCVTVKKPNAHSMMNSGMPCSSGHCIMHAGSVPSTAALSSNSSVSYALPNAGITFPPLLLAFSQLSSAAPPGAPILTDTIVLRF